MITPPAVSPQLHVHEPHRLHRLTRTAVRLLTRPTALVLLSALTLAPERSAAQSTQSLLPDANVLPSRGLRVRLATDFTRWDQFLGEGPRRNIGSVAAIDSIGVAQMPFLEPIETEIREASGLTAFRLNLGNIVAAANARMVTAPLIFEYGVTNRLTIGLVVPLVETRTTVFPQLNPRSVNASRANIGPNPAALGNATALGQNSAVVQAIRDAAGALAVNLANCLNDPSGSGCAALIGMEASIQALLQNSGNLATSIENLYGTNLGEHPGLPFVPLDDAPVQLAIDQRIETIVRQLAGYLGTELTVGQVAGANGPAARFELQQILNAVGRDSIGSTDHSSIGDISLGASYQLLNTYGDTSGTTFYKPQVRLTVNGTFRFGTGQPAAPNRVFDIATGYGQNGIEGSAATDVRFGRHISASALASYTHQLGSIAVARVPNAGYALFPLDVPFSGTYSAGNVMRLSLIPRIRLGGYFALTGNYTMVHVGADEYSLDETPIERLGPIAPFGFTASTAQQLGFGFLYSTIVGPARHPGAVPFEVSYEHLETTSASGGPVNKTFVDRLQLKVYFWSKRSR